MGGYIQMGMFPNPLTPEERAKTFSDRDFVSLSGYRLREIISEQIKQACDEARAQGYESARKDLSAIHGAKWAKEDYQKGFSDALEKVAKVALNSEISGYDEFNESTKSLLPQMQKQISDEIRALEPKP